MKYFLLKDGEKYGPLSIDELKGKKIAADDQIWRSDKDDWQNASDFDELSEVAFHKPPPTKSEIESTTLKNYARKIIKPIVLSYLITSILLGIIAAQKENSDYLTYKNGVTNKGSNYSSSRFGATTTPHSDIYIYKKGLFDSYYYCRYGSFLPGRDQEEYFYQKEHSIVLRPIKTFFTEVYLSKNERNSISSLTINLIIASLLNLLFLFLFIYLIMIILKKKKIIAANNIK